jgi:hypothetical protein
VVASVSELAIRNNESLTSLEGLEGVSSLSGYLSISDNTALTNLLGLSNITAISDAGLGIGPRYCGIRQVCIAGKLTGIGRQTLRTLVSAGDQPQCQQSRACAQRLAMTVPSWSR